MLYDNVFKEQVDSGVIERIENIDEFIAENPSFSVLAHMGVFRMKKETTKCRVVLMAQLAEKNPNTGVQISHNKAMLAGPTLNQKISTAVLFLRFDKFLVVFDLIKAFLSIELYEHDRNRLLCLWFKNVEKKDFSIVMYRFNRLCFGLRCSPTLLMVALYIILVEDQSGDESIDNMKRLMYHMAYMDNLSYSNSDPDKIEWACNEVQEILSKYKFGTQQWHTNVPELQKSLDAKFEQESEDSVPLLGMVWDKVKDTLGPHPPRLDSQANTRRITLRSMNSIYDIYGLYIPILLRARIFIQSLQSDSSIGWDTVLSDDRQREWVNIAKQVNAVKELICNCK